MGNKQSYQIEWNVTNLLTFDNVFPCNSIHTSGSTLRTASKHNKNGKIVLLLQFTYEYTTTHLKL